MDEFLLRYNKKVKYIILDTETFSLNLSFKFNRPWQIATLKVLGDKIVEKKDIHIDWSKVAPNLKIGSQAALITHYNESKEKSISIQPEEAFNLFWNDLIECQHLIMHNGLNFDIYLLRGYAEYMGVPWKFLVDKMIDTNAIAKGIKLGIPYTPEQGNFIEYQYRMSRVVKKGLKSSIKTLCTEFGFEYDENAAHDGLYDVYKNKEIWDKLKFSIEI